MAKEEEPKTIPIGRGEIANPNRPVEFKGTTDRVGKDERRIYIKKFFLEKRAYSPAAAPVDIFAYRLFIGAVPFSGRIFEDYEDARQYAGNYGFVITPGDPPEPTSDAIGQEEVSEENWFEENVVPLPEAAVAGVTKEKRSTFCSECGEALQAGWKFCITCGHKVDS